MWEQTKNDHEKQLYEQIFPVDNAVGGASVFPFGVKREVGQDKAIP